jgi:predicted acetyltransferase
MKLIKPSSRYKDSYLELKREFREDPAPTHPMVIERDCDDWQGFLSFLRDEEAGNNSRPDLVPALTFWLVDNEDRVVGVSHLRTRLNQRLIRSGGHIGYGIRPSARGLGYAHQILNLTLTEALRRGIQDVLVTCDPSNEASRRVILGAGGVYDGMVASEGKQYQRYWIFQ